MRRGRRGIDNTIYNQVALTEVLTDFQLLDMVRDDKSIDLGGVHIGRLHFKHVGRGVIYHLDYTDRAILGDTYEQLNVRGQLVFKYCRAREGSYYYLPEHLHLKRQDLRVLLFFKNAS